MAESKMTEVQNYLKLKIFITDSDSTIQKILRITVSKYFKSKEQYVPERIKKYWTRKYNELMFCFVNSQNYWKYYN